MYREPDPHGYVAISQPGSGRFLIILIDSHLSISFTTYMTPEIPVLDADLGDPSINVEYIIIKLQSAMDELWPT